MNKSSTDYGLRSTDEQVKMWVDVFYKSSDCSIKISENLLLLLLVYVHCAVSVIGLTAVDAAHK
jgi:hypothetical protein